jgi:hypothetical protein
LFSPGAPVSSTKKTDLHDIAQMVQVLKIHGFKLKEKEKKKENNF